MLFNSFDFLIYFPIVVGLFYALPQRWRALFLLAASYLFYMWWRPEYILLIIASTLVDYWVGLRLGGTEDGRKRKLLLAVSLTCNLGLLIAFKYYRFLATSLMSGLGFVGVSVELPVLDVLLPVGISFYTFQTLSYTIDVYRRKLKPTRKLIEFALYVSYFPQLVAGPIERAGSLLPQMLNQVTPRYENFAIGLRLILWGLFKKVVVADRIAPFVTRVYDDPGDHQGLTIIVATVLFAAQIYCDFSGYTDIAIGTARVLGVRLRKNFNSPYVARSIGEFWHRWHISLSTWFRDYVYVPLGGSRGSQPRWLMNILIVFLVSGLWHGAKWTFLVWGAMHGTFMVFSILTARIRERGAVALGLARVRPLQVAGQVMLTFTLVCLSWIMFRANSISDAFDMLSRLHVGWDLGEVKQTLLSVDPIDAALLIPLLLILVVDHVLRLKGSVEAQLAARPVWVRWMVYLALAVAIVLWGKHDEVAFIYFQF